MFGIFLIVLLYLALASLPLIAYVLQSLALYSLAERRQLRCPWLSWLPVGNMWILGSLADQYRLLSIGKKTYKRFVMLALMVINFVLLAIFFTLYIQLMAFLIQASYAQSGGAAGEIPFPEAEFMALFLENIPMWIITCVGLSVCTITLLILEYVSLYQLYCSCDPYKATLYFVVSLLFSISMPVFLFYCRDKDFGIPKAFPANPGASPEL